MSKGKLTTILAVVLLGLFAVGTVFIYKDILTFQEFKDLVLLVLGVATPIGFILTKDFNKSHSKD